MSESWPPTPICFAVEKRLAFQPEAKRHPRPRHRARTVIDGDIVEGIESRPVKSEALELNNVTTR